MNQQKSNKHVLFRVMLLVLLCSLLIPVVALGADPKSSEDKMEKASEAVVATIGERSYKTLQEAIDKAADGETIQLCMDTTESVKINKSITLDLSGHTLTNAKAEDGTAAIYIKDGKVVTIQNGTIIGGESQYTGSPSAINAEGGFNLKNLTLSGCTGSGYAIEISAYVDLNEDFEITNLNMINNHSHVIRGGVKNNMHFKDCHFEGNTPDGKNGLVAIGGRGNKTFERCTFLNNKAQRIWSGDATFTDCRFEGNTAQGMATISGDEVTLINSVVKNNTSNSKFGAAGVDVEDLTLTNSAVYDNTNTEPDGRHDFGKNCKNIDPKKMKDPEDASKDFSNYVLSENGKVLYEKPIFEAEINGKTYKKLTDAVENANQGDTIKIINTNTSGDIAPIEVDSLSIDKEITIDLNGRDVKSNEWSFIIQDPGKLSLVNSNKKEVSVEGYIYHADMIGSLSIGKKIQFDTWIYHNKNTVIDGSHKNLFLYSSEDLNDGHTMPIRFADDFEYIGLDKSLTILLAEDKDILNDQKSKVSDIIIAENAKAELLEKVSLFGITNPMVQVIFKPTSDSKERGNLVVHKDIFSAIYLDGKNGDDTKDGLTKDTAVKSFQKAKELAEEASTKNERVIIHVIGTVTVDGEETWKFSDPNKIKLYRDAQFKGNLVQVNGKAQLTLEDITIDGNKNAVQAKNALILVDGGSLLIKKGASLQNNMLENTDDYPPLSGGAVRANSGATVTLDGGSISGNTAIWGGGIFAYKSTINIKDGVIHNNKAINSLYYDDDKASGGAIATWYNSTINISGGEISNNSSEYYGGGLSLGVSRVVNNGGGSKLHMTGGHFIGNIATQCGGAMFVQGGMKGTDSLGDTHSVAHIEGGVFKKNKAYKGDFGGGAIYVNGSQLWEDYVSGKLQLNNAFITNNKAEIYGGGYASCPTSNTQIYVKHGAAIFANQSKEGKDIHIDASIMWHGRKSTPEYDIAESMLGGIPCHWTYDDGMEVPLSDLHGKLSGSLLNLTSKDTDWDKEAIRKIAKVIITENYAGMRGGAIGSNGDITIGVADTIDVTVNKTWEDENNKAGKRPESIKIALYRSLEDSKDEAKYIGFNEIKPDASGNWSTTFKYLAKENNEGKKFIYTVKEIVDQKNPIPYRSETKGSVSGDSGTITMTNIYDPKTPTRPMRSTQVTVEGIKTWDDKDNQEGKRPESITIRLMKNGTEVDSKVVTKADGWKWKFEDLPKYENGKLIIYTISEDAVSGYRSEISGYNVTNHYISSKTSVFVSKTWVDENNKDGKRPESITIRLYSNGVDTGKTLILTATNQWKGTFTDLDELKDGKKIKYTVREENIGRGYTSAITGNQDTGYVIINMKTTIPSVKVPIRIPKAGNAQKGY